MPDNPLYPIALNLRKSGYSYSEIQDKTKISQSTLWGWLREIKLSKHQKRRLDKKIEENRKLGSQTLLNNRLAKTFSIIESARLEVQDLKPKDLWIVGVVLYWTEGSKQKDHNPSREVIFSNSDPEMIKIYLKWLKVSLNITDDRILFEIYIHETYKRRAEDLRLFWSSVTDFPSSKFIKIYFKDNKVRSYRKNRGPEYNGVLRIYVRRSTDLNRKVAGWIKGICNVLLTNDEKTAYSSSCNSSF